MFTNIKKLKSYQIDKEQHDITRNGNFYQVTNYGPNFKKKKKP